MGKKISSNTGWFINIGTDNRTQTLQKMGKLALAYHYIQKGGWGEIKSRKDADWADLDPHLVKIVLITKMLKQRLAYGIFKHHKLSYDPDLFIEHYPAQA